MKKIIAFAVMLLAAFSVQANTMRIVANDDVRQALYGALDKAAEALKSAPFGNRPIALLPMKAGHDILSGRVKNLLVNSGFVCVEGKEDPMWDEILKEIEWDERKSDILDARTIAKFGKLKAAAILFQCEIRTVDKNVDRIYSEIELRATDIATKQVIWGASFAHRYYIGKEINGIISLTDDLRSALNKSFAEAGKSLLSPAVAGKLSNIKTVTVVPLSGDIDSYMTGLGTAMLTRTHLMPQNPHIPSLTQIRYTARDGQLKSDAIFYGSVRALHKIRPEIVKSGKRIYLKYQVVAEIQLFIEDAKSGNILWGETVTMTENAGEEREMTPEELKKFRKEKMDNISGEIEDEIAENWKFYLKLAAVIAVVIVLLAVGCFALKAFMSYNNVR